MMKYKYSSTFHNSLSVKINIHEIIPISEYNDTGDRFNPIRFLENISI